MNCVLSFSDWFDDDYCVPCQMYDDRCDSFDSLAAGLHRIGRQERGGERSADLGLEKVISRLLEMRRRILLVDHVQCSISTDHTSSNITERTGIEKNGIP